MTCARRKDDGFSLIEALVAMGVFSTAVIGILQLNTQTLQTRNMLDRRFEARTVAENAMVEAFGDPEALDETVSSGTAKQGLRTYVWTRTVTPSPRDGLVQILVEVRDSDDRVVHRLETLKAAE